MAAPAATPEMAESEVMKYLAVDPATLLAEQSVSFDAKKSVWIAYKGLQGYAAAEVISADGDDVTVKELVENTEMVIKKEACEQMNPPKYEKCTDMANLTYLNEASILYNLRARYQASLMYTYSGLFCIAVNPYRRLPIYNDTCIKMYRGKRRVEMPPHLFSIVDVAYQNMLQDHENQSMLITGESGAGKTENTKKVIMYIAKVAGAATKPGAPAEGGSKIQGSLDEQIVEANPLMEAFGNAKTIRNNNSSRFGKFIRAHFSNIGKLAGADIESYLLEKNRVTFQLSAERNYHIFYQLLYCTTDEVFGQLCLPSRISSDYALLKLSQPTVKGIDDAEEYAYTENAIVVLGFQPDERIQMFSIVAALLNWNNMQLKERPRDEQAEIVDPAEGERCAHLLGINVSDFHKSLVKPRVKVGTEYVNKTQNMSQVTFTTAALSKSLYERMFTWQVARINQAFATKERRDYFIGVLDIAGFEIFEYNSFDQLCINLTNEKLQQFFNHTMFVLEQEEYKKEGLVWETLDFGMDLELTINLIEKPGGVFPMLEEECIVPKASDDTYLQKLHKKWSGKHQSYGKPSPKAKGKDGDFILHHYAGSVGYSIAGWLEKNKDPINEDTAGLLAKAGNNLVSLLFSDYNPDSKQRKGSSSNTISKQHREALRSLLATLGKTSPHFVRCIIPNEVKSSTLIDGDLVLHQLRCNGVLEGIRICRKGFPSRMPFADFKQRYSILAASAVPAGFVDGKVACTSIVEALQMDESEYRIGLTKIFFRSGIVGELEDMRDERLSTIISQFQACCKGHVQKKEFQKMNEKKIAIAVIQRNVRKFFDLKDWAWWKLFCEVRPMLALARDEEDIKGKEEALKEAQEKAANDSKRVAELEDEMTKAISEREKLFNELQSQTDTLVGTEEKLMETTLAKDDLETKLNEALEKLDEEEGVAKKLGDEKKKSKAQIEDLTTKFETATSNISKLESEKLSRDKTVDSLNAEVARLEEGLSKLGHEKKSVEDNLSATIESLQTAEDKGKRLAKEKGKLEGTLSDVQANLAKEKEAKSKLDREKKKVDTALRDTESKLGDTASELLEAKDTITKRDKIIREGNEKMEGFESQIKALQKKIIELTAHTEELDEELENEKRVKKKVESSKAEVEADMDALHERLEEAGGATIAQVEVSKKREAEIAKLRLELEETNAAGETALTNQKSKFNAIIAELQDEIDAVKKAKAKSDKDRTAAAAECDNHSTLLDATKKKAATFQKQARTAEDKLKSATDTISELEAAVAEAAAKPSGIDSVALAAAVEKVEHELGIALKNAKNVAGQLEEAKEYGDNECKAKFDAQQKLKHALDELESLSEGLEEEQGSKIALQSKLAKAAAEAQHWKNKYDVEGESRVEELEDAKRKLTTRVQEMEQSLTAAEAKAAGMEKVKNRMNEEVEDLLLDLERAQAQASSLEKKQKKVDVQIGEWKTKCDDIQAELDKSQRDARNYSTELLKLRTALEDSIEKLDILKKENRILSADLTSVTEQLSEGGKSSHEVEKLRRKLEMEKDEVQIALEEVETALESEEGKLLKMQLEYTQLKQTSDRKLTEKDDEIDSVRKNSARQVESLQHMLDSQSKASAEVAKNRKKLEDMIVELEAQRDNVLRANSDQQKQIKKLSAQVKEFAGLIDDEARGRDDMRELSNRADRRANELSVQVDEVRLALEQTERTKKQVEAENLETIDRVAELQTLYNNMSGAKRKAEADYHTLHEEIDELENARLVAEDKANKASTELNRIMQELVVAHDVAASAEKARAMMMKQIQDLTAKLEAAEMADGKGLKVHIRKLETRTVELENDLDVEIRRSAEAIKVARKAEKKSNELQFQLSDTQKAADRTNETAEKLNQKIRKMRLQIEETETNMNSLASKYKKATLELEDAEERCEAAESALLKARQRARGGTGAGTRGISAATSRQRSRVRTPQE